MKLRRDKVTGDYYSEDGQYQVERCLHGYNVNRLDHTGRYRYDFSTDTLREARAGLDEIERGE